MHDSMGEPQRAPSLNEAVARIDTGHSWVFLTPDAAYKVKRPLLEPGRDYRTLAARQRACDREARLNRPFAGDTYQGVVPLFGSEMDWTERGQGEPIEYAVRMKRLPEDRLLGRMLDAGTASGIGERDLEMLADLIVSFHRESRSSERIAKAGEVVAIEGAVRAALKALAETKVDQLVIDHLESALLEFLATRRESFDARIGRNKVRDGHGDLRAEHVFLTEPPVLLGRVEHSDRARFGDILEDVATLLVDLEARGAVGAEFAERFWRILAPRLGERVDEPLLDFYRALKAIQRIGLGCPGAASADGPGLIELARAKCRRFHRPHLFVTVGMMGAGKTTLAQALSQAAGVARVSATDARQALFPTADPKASPVRLSRAQIEQLYERMCAEAERLLRAEVSVVLDADFLTRTQRARALALAERLAVEPLFLECRLTKSDAIARLDRRRKRDRTMPRGRPELYDEELARFEPTEDVPPGRLLPLGTRLPVPFLLDTVLKALPNGQGDRE